MKKARIVLVAVLCFSLTASLLGLTACGGGGTAATVNGVEIPEQDITDEIQAMRSQNPEYEDETTWAQALASSGLTPESLRESVIDRKARDIVITQEAEAQGITVDEAAIDEQVAQTKEQVGGDDANWNTTLQQYGYKDEQAYRNMLVVSDYTNQLYEAYEVKDPTDDQLKEYIAANPTAVEGWSLADGATEEATDETAVDETTDETATEEATDETATDEATADEATPEEAPVEETPAYTADDVDLTTIPEDVLDQYKELWIQANKATQFNEWTTELVEDADIQINDMPENVPYNVDMSLAETPDTSTDEPTASSSSPEAVEAAISEGLVIEDVTVGDGDEAKDGDTVKVLYTGTLEDGTVFDSTADRNNEPFEFTLGTGSVIKGWDAGVVGMKVGGTRLLTIPASLGYGDTETGSIPAGSTLYFEIELVEVTPAG